ncbi:MAG: DUF2207 domain-containing protein, partial [Candidatus Acidiferrum sp.]
MPPPHKPSSRFTTGLFALVLLFALAVPLSAKEQQLLKFYSDIDILPNSDVYVTETITFRFIGGPWHGIYRTIPVEYSGPHGSNFTLFLKVKNVTDENENKLKYETSRDGKNLKLKIYIPDADNSTRTVNIEYVVSNAIRFFDDHDEFYWNVTGDEWSLPIQQAGAHIVLPDGTQDIRALVFTGTFRSTGHDATEQVNGNGVEVRTINPLSMHEGLTVAVAFDKGFVRPPSPLVIFGRFLVSN